MRSKCFARANHAAEKFNWLLTSIAAFNQFSISPGGIIVRSDKIVHANEMQVHNIHVHVYSTDHKLRDESH